MHFNHIPPAIDTARPAPAIDTARPALTSSDEKSINSKIMDSDHVIAIIHTASYFNDQ